MDFLFIPSPREGVSHCFFDSPRTSFPSGGLSTLMILSGILVPVRLYYLMVRPLDECAFLGGLFILALFLELVFVRALIPRILVLSSDKSHTWYGSYMRIMNKLRTLRYLVNILILIFEQSRSWMTFVVMVSVQAIAGFTAGFLTRKIRSILDNVGEANLGVYVSLDFPISRFVFIDRIIRGNDIRVCSSMPSGSFRDDLCSICHDRLLPSHSPKSVSSANSRVNLSVNRCRIYGPSRLFRTHCGHVFHRECLMKWISEKPIRMRIHGDTNETSADTLTESTRDQASCPLCKTLIQLRVINEKFNTLYLIASSFCHR